MTDITWTAAADYTDIRYEHSGTGIAKVTIARPEVRNAFRPETVAEMIAGRACSYALSECDAICGSS